MPDRPNYTLVHRTCGHALAVGNDRATLERVGAGHHGYRVRTATDDDMAGVLAERRCATCTVPS